MQKENSGSSQNRKQEDVKRQPHSGSEASPDVGGNEYTAAFILYCQKTLDNFRHVYGDTYASEAALGPGFPPGLGSSLGFGPGLGSVPNFKSGSEPEDDELELEEDYSSSDKDKEALEELSKQFEQMLRTKAQFEDDELELEEDYKSDPGDYREKEALREFSEQFEQMLKAKAQFEDGEELEQNDESELDNRKEKEELEEFFEQFEQMFSSKIDLENGEELEQNDESELDNRKEKEELEEFFGQFEQMLKNETETENKSLKFEQDDTSQSGDHKGKEALKDLLGQFEQILNSEDDELELEPDNSSQSNGYKKEGLEEPSVRPDQLQRTARGAGALHHATDSPDSYEEENASRKVKEPATSAHSDGLNDAEIDEALSGVGVVVKSAKENLGIVEAFWEERESERAKLLVKAEITQEQFEQVVTRVGSHLYDVKDCLEGWGDLSMLPETYEQLLLANNELSEIFQKMYGKRKVEVQDKSRELVSEDDDDWELEDDDEVSDWALDDDDWDFDDEDDEDEDIDD